MPQSSVTEMPSSSRRCWSAWTCSSSSSRSSPTLDSAEALMQPASRPSSTSALSSSQPAGSVVVSATSAARLRRRAVVRALDRLGELLLGHLRPPVDAGAPGLLVELGLRLARVDAPVALPGALERVATALGRLRIRGTLLVLELPVIAPLLRHVLDGGPGGAVRALLGVVGLLGGIQGLG